MFYIDSQCCQFHRMHECFHYCTFNTLTELMSGAEIMEGNNKWCQIKKVGAPETNQLTN